MSNFEWVKKIELNVEENEDGTMVLNFTWDENDPDLKDWTDLGSKKQEEFVLAALYNSCKDILKDDNEQE